MTWRTFGVKAYWYRIIIIFVKEMPWGLHKTWRDRLLSFCYFSVFYRYRKCAIQSVQTRSGFTEKSVDVFKTEFFVLNYQLLGNSDYWAFTIFFRNESCSSSWKNITRCVSNTIVSGTLLLLRKIIELACIFPGFSLHLETDTHHEGWCHRSFFDHFLDQVKSIMHSLCGTSMFLSINARNNFLIFTITGKRIF